MSAAPPQRRRYALVGTGARAELYTSALVAEHADVAELVALADVNPLRLAAHNRRLADLGAAPVPTYPADEFAVMLAKERVDAVVVSTVDATHDGYIVAALAAGCDVITEKPMTTDEARCRRVLAAVREAQERASPGLRNGGSAATAATREGGASEAPGPARAATALGRGAASDAPSQSGRRAPSSRVTVTFNYRYNPVHERVRELLAGGEIGEVASVHFEWLLDVRHGADYFRRWHRDKASSGGLLVHKASHHFDLVNWWLGAEPVEVYAAGRLFFYGPDAGRRHGYARDYDRVHGSPAAHDDPFALHLADNPGLRALYLDAEEADGYHRDRNVFAPGVSIEDDMAVLVRYSTGASMSYHLTAYAPWEGYRIAFNGSRGRLEVEVVENDHVAPALAGAVKGRSATLHGVEAAAERGSVRVLVRPFWAPPREIPVRGLSRRGHGGADGRMLAALLRPDPPPDPLGRRATHVEGARALLVGLAANRSIATGDRVRVADLGVEAR